MFGLPGTGKRVEFKLVIIFAFEDGLITHEQRIYDFTSVLMQIGVFKLKPARV
jgi:predicted ester cyclase